MNLAKVTWRLTSLPVHSALLACQLYRYLANFSLDKDSCITNGNWFEGEAIKMMDKVAYSDVKEILVWKWEKLGVTALEIADEAKCQRFIAHNHLQRLLDDVYSTLPSFL